MPIKPPFVSNGNITPSGRIRRAGKGTGRSCYKCPKAPGIGKGRARATGLVKNGEIPAYDLYCWSCKTVSKGLRHISPEKDLNDRSSWVCEECYQNAQESRKCHSEKDRCKEDSAERCQFCLELTDPCRFVWMWDSGELYISCPVCPSDKEGIKEWICKPDYLHDHSLARCCECKMIDLSSPRYYGRGECCKRM